jgi:lipid-A-disaccharide synthase
MELEKNKLIRIFIVAGEPSGDMHGAILMQKLKKLHEKIEFLGIGGKKMQAEGLNSMIPIEKISVIGITEVLKKIPLFLSLKKKCEKILLNEKIDCFVPIDYPGFNLKLAKFATSQEIPVYYYIAPQLWAWGKNRWKKLKNVTSELLVVFPFEEEYFREKGINATFVGHPLLDNEKFNLPKDKKKSLKKQNLIAFFPGSRKQEVEKNLDFFAEIAKILSKKLTLETKKFNENIEFGFAISSNLEEKDFDLLKQKNINYKLYSDSHQLMLEAKVGVVKAGTSTLEAALLGLNSVMAYKTSKSHYFFGKRVINLNYIALPNILANKEIIPEFIQNDANPEKLAEAIQNFLENPEKCEAQKEEFGKIREILIKENLEKNDNFGASENAAKIILNRILK